MAIIIPKAEIYSYDFNILKSNNINKVSINEVDTYNFKKVNIGSITTPRRFLHLSNEEIRFENTLTSDTMVYRTEVYKQSNGSDRVSPNTNTSDGTNLLPTIDTYFGFVGSLQLDNTFSKDFPKQITQVVADSPYYVYSGEDITLSNPIKSGTDSQSLTIEIKTNNLIDFQAMVNNLADGSLGKIEFFPNLTNDNKMRFILVILVKRLTFPEAYSENRTSYNISLEYDTKDVTTKYEYSNQSSLGGEIKLDANPLFSIFNGDGTNKIFDVIAPNIVGKYNKGKMTLEIETRYTKFKDHNGNNVNEGKPYLIKVGDIVKPEMNDRFKDFQYEYIVTSSEYEYNGSDKVYLKLLQI